MPPWQPEPGHGDFGGSRRLSDSEIQLFRTWAQQGAPEGDPRDLPAPPQWPSEWELGPPGSGDHPAALPASRRRSRHVPERRRPGRFQRDEVRPGVAVPSGEPRVVHHATIQMDTTGLSRRLDARDDSPGYEGVVALTARAPDGFFLDWAPGHRPATAVDGTAWPLDGASDLVVMLHLKPSGKPEPVQASLGLYFSETPPSRLPVMLQTDAPGSGHRAPAIARTRRRIHTSCRSTSWCTPCSRTRIISAATSRARPTCRTAASCR